MIPNPRDLAGPRVRTLWALGQAGLMLVASVYFGRGLTVGSTDDAMDHAHERRRRRRRLQRTEAGFAAHGQ